MVLGGKTEEVKNNVRSLNKRICGKTQLDSVDVFVKKAVPGWGKPFWSREAVGHWARKEIGGEEFAIFWEGRTVSRGYRVEILAYVVEEHWLTWEEMGAGGQLVTRSLRAKSLRGYTAWLEVHTINWSGSDAGLQGLAYAKSVLTKRDLGCWLPGGSISDEGGQAVRLPGVGAARLDLNKNVNICHGVTGERALKIMTCSQFSKNQGSTDHCWLWWYFILRKMALFSLFPQPLSCSCLPTRSWALEVKITSGQYSE